MEPVGQGERYPGFSAAPYGGVAESAPDVVAASAFPPVFRPLSTGEVLDRTFVLYRRHFWLFACIGMLPGAVLLLSAGARLLFAALTHRTELLRPGVVATTPMGALTGSVLMMEVYLLPAVVLFLLAYGASHAATVDAVNRLEQGMNVTAGIAYQAVRGRWLRWSGIVLRQGWSLLWPSMPGLAVMGAAVGAMAMPASTNKALLAGTLLLLATALVTAGIVFGVINFIRNSLAIAAGVSENLGVNAAIRRSKALAAGRKGRLFLAWLLVYAFQMVVAAVQMPLLFAAMSLRGGAFVAVQVVTLLVQFAAVTLVTPVASIAFTLFYIDERVRREGFDIELLMRRTLPQAGPAYAGDLRRA